MKLYPITLICLAACPIRAQVEPGNAFRVHVIDSITGNPIAGANVALDDETGRTDRSGAFSGRAASAGAHLLIVARKGYRMTTSEAMGRKVELKPGVATDVTVEMLPLGVIAGRVVDQYGDPVRHAVVHAEDPMNTPGQEQTFESYSAAITDDRGEYRIAGIEPGKHYLAAEYGTARETRISGQGSRYHWPETGGLILYPDATTMELAREIEVTAGQTTRIDDIHLKIQPIVAVTGRIKPAPTGSHVSVSLRRTLPVGLNAFATVQGGLVERDGSFRIEVLPGAYVLTAEDPATGKASKPLTVQVGEKGIADLELNLSVLYQLKGRITIDGSERTDLTKLLLNLGDPPVKIDSDGTFETTLPSGKGVYMLQNLPEGWYVKQVLLAGQPLKGRLFEVEPGTSDLQLVLSPRGARIEVTVDAGADSLPPAAVALLPESGPVPDVELMPHGQPDESGRFVLTGVPPGSWRVFVLDASNWITLMRPDILLKNRSAAPLITVAEGERKTITAPLSKIQMDK